MRLIGRLDIKLDHVVKGKMLEGVKKKYSVEYLFKHLSNENELQKFGVTEIVLNDSIASLYGWKNHFLTNLEIPYTGVPVSLGGGLASIEDIIAASTIAEKVVLNTINFSDISLLEKADSIIGSQSVVVELHVLKYRGQEILLTENGKIQQSISLDDYLKNLTQIDFGELYVLSVSNDGMGYGLDYDLAKKVIDYFPNKSVVLGGGMRKEEDFVQAKSIGLSGVMCSSVYHDYILKCKDDLPC